LLWVLKITDTNGWFEHQNNPTHKENLKTLAVALREGNHGRGIGLQKFVNTSIYNIERSCRLATAFFAGLHPNMSFTLGGDIPKLALKQLSLVDNNLLMVQEAIDDVSGLSKEQLGGASKAVLDALRSLKLQSASLTVNLGAVKKAMSTDRRYIPGNLLAAYEEIQNMFARELQRAESVFFYIDETTCVKMRSNCAVVGSWLHPVTYAFRNHTLNVLDVTEDVTMNGVKYTGASGHGLFVHVNKYLGPSDMDIAQNLKGLTTDGASAVYRKTADPKDTSTSFGSVFARNYISEDGLKLLKNWCIAHRSSLVLLDSLQAMPAFVPVKKTLQLVTSFFSSVGRVNALREKISPAAQYHTPHAVLGLHLQ
jgi:hypothetical protein